ncbi:rubrerythrin family protein [archaeon]|jgi:rubrerythrin|nr:rubrerythrin family protein [Candidatus Woesearchaeota archaeon]MBT4135678.1 rubrerythrin family protein [archaeon]MBT4242039.1 rubrerythrin family protein [archaeon]MBT4417727.1 rubrerythrin family protein [archaeon]
MKQTLKNLTKAFIGESQARNRYTFYAKVAKKEGYEQIAEIFLITADQEKVHAKRLFEHIQELKKEFAEDEQGEIEVDASCPTVYESNVENLKAAIDGEHYEYSEMYPEFADVAEKEGYPEIALRLRSIAKAEEHHAERYKKLLEQLEKGSLFKKSEEVWWICRECGYAYFGKEAPEKCPSCDHPKAYYQVKCEEF